MRNLSIYIIIALSFLCASSLSAQTRVHNVRPGDSFASVAAKYGVSEQALREMNPMFDECYVGMTISIPEKDEKSTEVLTDYSLSQKSVESQEGLMLFREGRLYYDADEYSKAVKVLNKSIRLSPMGSSYYYRGMSHYKLGHWKQAVEDLNYASTSSDLTSAQKYIVKAYLDRSKAKRVEQQQKNKETWSNVGKVIGGAVIVAGAVAGAVMLDNYADSNTPTSTTTYSSNNTSSPKLYASMSDAELQAQWDKEMKQVFVATVVQGKLQELQEYESYCQMVESFGSERPTMDEWRIIQGAAILQMKEEGYDIIAEQKEMIDQQLADNERRRQEDKEARFKRMGYDLKSSSSSTSSSSSSRTSSSSTKSSSSTYSSRSSSKPEKPKYDAKQQFKSEGVYSSDYKYKKKVTLYTRHGNDAKVMFSGKDLCEKGGFHYVNISNKYYKVIYSNWGRFNRSIVYGHTALYFNM